MLERLRKWRKSPHRRPLILQGARQTGKTWLLQEFGRLDFSQTLYVNFENNEAAAALFEQDFDPHRILDMLGLLVLGRKTTPEDTLVILDEIQEKPRVLTSLKYMAEQAPEYAVCAAGSLLGLAMHEGASFPVGKVDMLQLEPLSFEEFLWAEGKKELADSLHGMALPLPFANKLNDSLRLYMATGGMPSVVNIWQETHNLQEVRREQRLLLQSYEADFSKHVPSGILASVRQSWDSIPTQLAKENKKFSYAAVRKGGRGRDFQDPLNWLQDAGMTRCVNCVNKGEEPLDAYRQEKQFKIYHLDVGLLACMAGVRPGIIAEGDKVYSEFNGALAEQFVLQELNAYMPDTTVYYWASGNAAEVEFVFCGPKGIVPVEVKSGNNLRAKSLKVFCDKYAPPQPVIVSNTPLAMDHGVLKVPFCYLWRLDELLGV